MSALSKLLKKGKSLETPLYDSSTDSSSPNSTRLSYDEPSINIRKHYYFESPSSFSKFIMLKKQFDQSFKDIKISNKEKWEFANYLIDKLALCHEQISQINKLYKKTNIKFHERIYTEEYKKENLMANETNINFLENFHDRFDEIVKNEKLSILPNGKPARDEESLKYFFKNLKTLINDVLKELKVYNSEYKKILTIKQNTKTSMEQKKLLLGGKRKITRKRIVKKNRSRKNSTSKKK